MTGESILDRLPDGVVVVGPDRAIAQMNGAAERLTGGLAKKRSDGRTATSSASAMRRASWYMNVPTHSALHHGWQPVRPSVSTC